MPITWYICCGRNQAQTHQCTLRLICCLITCANHRLTGCRASMAVAWRIGQIPWWGDRNIVIATCTTARTIRTGRAHPVTGFTGDLEGNRCFRCESKRYLTGSARLWWRDEISLCGNIYSIGECGCRENRWSDNQHNSFHNIFPYVEVTNPTSYCPWSIQVKNRQIIGLSETEILEKNWSTNPL